MVERRRKARPLVRPRVWKKIGQPHLPCMEIEGHGRSWKVMEGHGGGWKVRARKKIGQQPLPFDEKRERVAGRCRAKIRDPPKEALRSADRVASDELSAAQADKHLRAIEEEAHLPRVIGRMVRW